MANEYLIGQWYGSTLSQLQSVEINKWIPERELIVLLAYNVRGKSLYPIISVARNIRICGQDEPNSVIAG